MKKAALAMGCASAYRSRVAGRPENGQSLATLRTGPLWIAYDKEVAQPRGSPDLARVDARAMNLLIARGAYWEAARMYPGELIELRQGARVIGRSK
jgi:hypothetical protein